jgi:hypothetical protein
MDRFSHPTLPSLRAVPSRESAPSPANLVPFGPLGAGQWTGHPIGLVIVLGFVAMALIGIPESRAFFAISLGLGVVAGLLLWFWHRSKSFF